MSGSSTANRGHDVPHLSSRRCSAHERRPRCLSGVQRSGGPCNHSSTRTVQQWSVIPAAIAGVMALLAWARRAGGGAHRLVPARAAVGSAPWHDQRIAMGRSTTGRRTVSAAIRRRSKAVPCVALNVLRHSVQRQPWSLFDRRRRLP